LHIQRLASGQGDLAKALFALLAEVLGEGRSTASENYIQALLEQDSFWVIAAVDEKRVVGGLTAHILPMTKAEQSELLIYDVAIDKGYQRQGIGHMLIDWVRNEASTLGIASVFVLADNEDMHAIRFYRKLDGADSSVTLFSWS
jgi:aminoglycoside 3-N-acetyltransferase I